MLVVGLVAAACTEQAKDAPKSASSSAAVTSAAPVSQEPRSMPQVMLHPDEVLIGFDSLSLKVPAFASAFKNLVAKYPVGEPSQVVCNIDRKVKSVDATRIIYALYANGARSVEVRTPPRGTFADKLVVTTQGKAKDAPACTFTTMILKDLGATFWKRSGGLAKRYTKGMAGPDLSAMHEGMGKEAKTCKSTALFFSADEQVEWGHAFDIATSVQAQSSYGIDTFALLEQPPTPGRPLRLDP